jgi:phosphate starvation-inducible PhoH-like protein
LLPQERLRAPLQVAKLPPQNQLNIFFSLVSSKNFLLRCKDTNYFCNFVPKFKKLQLLIEKHIVLEDIDPVIFYGVGNGHLQMIRSLYPKLRIMARDNVIRVLGDEEQMAAFEESVEKLRAHVLRFNSLGDEDILDIIKGKRTRDDVPDGVVVYSMSGRPIKARTPNQQRLIEAYNHNDMVFAVGPAGTGKTYLSIALAVKALKDKTAKKIILSRPAVEAGEKLGFLPGDMKDKIDPYLQPLYDALEDMLPQVKLQDMMEKNIIQIAPLAFMRGRTLNDAIVILDEAQNTTPAQIRMFLTRMGWNTKMIITGDMTQIDLPHSQKSGLIEALHILNNVEGIGIVNLQRDDIVRHKLVTRIVNAYEEFDKEMKGEIPNK